MSVFVRWTVISQWFKEQDMGTENVMRPVQHASKVRRGVYWHLLEFTWLFNLYYSPMFDTHLFNLRRSIS